jgi:hypothetical protein
MTITDEPTIVRPDSAEDLESLVNPFEKTDDPKLRTHSINPPANLHIWRPGMSTKDVLFIARSQGLEVVALCGFRFVPVHDPEDYDACEECIRLAGEIMAGMGE